MRTSHGAKWNHYGADVLPMWVADMDFPIAGQIRQAISDYALGNDFGYPVSSGIPGLLDAVSRHLDTKHGVSYANGQIWPTSGIIPALFLLSRALAGPGDEVIVQPPAYPPFAWAVTATGRKVVENPLALRDGRWEMDLEHLESVITPATRFIVLCNPQNPTGRVFSRSELEGLADVARRHNLWVVSDELHADLVLEGRHVPFAAVSDDAASRTITLYGPTKAFNIAGLKVGFAMSHNAALLDRLKAAAVGVLTPPNVLAQAAARAAFDDAGEWLEGTIAYLRDNRQSLLDFIAQEMPSVSVSTPEGTYLAWLDFRALIPPADLGDFLEKTCRVGLNLGDTYGTGGEGYARLNFATSRQVLLEALGRLRDGLQARRSTILAGAQEQPLA